jgi:hypothetical protein
MINPSGGGRIVWQLRVVAVLGLIIGALIWGASVFSYLSGIPLTGNTLLWIAIGTALLIVSAHTLSPRHVARASLRFSALSRLPEEELSQAILTVARRARAILLVLLAAEIPIALLAWPSQEWEPWIFGFVGTTVMMILLTTVVMIMRRTRKI